MKFKDKIKNWLFKDEIKRIQMLETSYKDQIDWCKERADDIYRASERARLSYEQSQRELEECRKFLNQVCDIGVDINPRREDSWGVICVAGRPKYVKFLPLNHSDAQQVLNFLKQFQYSNSVVDSPLLFKRMLDNYFI